MTAKSLSAEDRPVQIQKEILSQMGYKECDVVEKLYRLDFSFLFKFVFSKINAVSLFGYYRIFY